LYVGNEQLKDSIVELRWKPFEDMQKQISRTISEFDHLKELMNEDNFFDNYNRGWNLTEEGIAYIALIGGQMEQTRKSIANYRKALEKLDAEYKNHNISLEEYIEKSEEMVDTIQSLVEANEGYRDSIIELYKT